MAIIGIDFGNYNTFPCFISDFDPGTRMGGTVHDLLPSGLQDGIPSVFYYSRRALWGRGGAHPCAAGEQSHPQSETAPG